MSKPLKDTKYTETHEWILPDTDTGELIIGITQHAQEQLGEIVFVELPQILTRVSTGDTAGVIESVKAASDIYVPINGEIMSVNENLADNPSLINDSPYEDGWLFRMRGDLKGAKHLLTAKQYDELIGS